MKKNMRKALKMLTVVALLILSLGTFTSRASAASSKVKAPSKEKTYSVTGCYKVKSSKTSVASAKKSLQKNTRSQASKKAGRL